MHAIRSAMQRMSLLTYFTDWASVVTMVFQIGMSPLSLQGHVSRGWLAKTRLAETSRQAWCLSFAEATAFQMIVILNAATRMMVATDRRSFYEQLAIKSQQAAEGGDSKGTFAIVHALAAVFLEYGTVSS